MSEKGVLGVRNELRSLEPFLLIRVVAVELIEDRALIELGSISQLFSIFCSPDKSLDVTFLSLHFLTTPFSVIL